MDDREKISIRIKELRSANGYSQSYVAEKLFVSQAAYSLMESTQNAVTAEHIVQLGNLYNVTADFLLTGNKKLIEMTPENGFLPLIDSKAHAGFIKNAHRGNVMEEFEYYKIPGYNPTKDSFLIEIEGESMKPTIIPGDVLICQVQKKLDYVIYGSVVVVVTKGELLATRLHEHTDKEYFLVEGDNPQERSTRKIKKSDIVELLVVLSKVSNALIPHREIAFKGRLQSLEESVNFLSKKVYKIEKQMNPKTK